MESVEEICDYVALINKSKTVLEGPIQQIKNKFSNNTYLVQLEEPLLEENNLFNFLEKDSCFFQLSLKKAYLQKMPKTT